MRRFLAFSVLTLAVLAFVPATFAQGRGRGHHPARKRAPLNLLKKAVENLERLEARLDGHKKMGPKQLAGLKLEIKEARLQVQEFLMEVKDRKAMLPAYECCPCHGQAQAGVTGPDGGVQLTVNVQGGVAEEPMPALGPEPVPEVVVEPLTDQAFGNLQQALKEQSFADDKLTVLQSAAAEAWFTVAQVKELLKLFSFPDDKLKALRLVKSQLVDPENKFLLYGAFVHSSDKDEAKKILETR